MSDHETAVVWFREDLRLHDNEALVEACEASELVPLYVVDPREFGERAFGGDESFAFQKTGPHRARFLRESLADLRSSLRTRGSDLVVREGHPESVVPDVAADVGADRVHFATYPTVEEVEVEEATKEALRDVDVTPQRYWTHTLHHLNDLPTTAYEMPDTFTPWRKEVERGDEVRDALPVPSVPELPDALSDPGEIPSQSDLGLENTPEDDRAVLPFAGGETRGLERVEEYVWERDHLREYKETRNGMLGADYSSKFSAWLNLGCLSPRRVHEEIKRYEDERVSNDSTYWLSFELRWRDFFQFQFVKHGSQFFQPGGIREHDVDWRRDHEAETYLDRWKRGETGVPFVDANMRELNRTGYVSNRGRQNVASFLANNCRVDWRQGAAYFETQLVDYDVASNYGNWAYNSQVGNDSRDKYFNVVKQARRYDDDAEYVKTWCPELEPLPPEYAHEPWTMSSQEMAEYGVELGVDYPRPMLDLERSYEKLR
jgi:deoxyribodipyrimidine photo-lyase